MKYNDPDGWILVEDRSRPIGSPVHVGGSRIAAHPIDAYRRRFPDRTAGLDDLAVLELWYADEVDRRLNEAGLTAYPRTTWAKPLTPDEAFRLKTRVLYGPLAARDPLAFVKVPPTS